MLLGKVESAHGPLLVAFERADWVNVAHFHAIANIAFKHLEQLQELPSDAFDEL